jgi:hypothetical protein
MDQDLRTARKRFRASIKELRRLADQIAAEAEKERQSRFRAMESVGILLQAPEEGGNSAFQEACNRMRKPVLDQLLSAKKKSRERKAQNHPHPNVDGVIIDCIPDIFPGLSQGELIWLLAWNIADGEWDRIGLKQVNARMFLLEILGKVHGDPVDTSKRSRGRLQQRLMALREGTFEEIQQEAPFSRYARNNIDELLSARTEEGEAGFARVWGQVFRSGWEAARERQDPIRIIGDAGDCEERALEVRGAADTETRIAAEWWYLYYTFGRAWTPGMHVTLRGKEEGAHFSVHDIHMFPDSRKEIYFRLPW